MKLDSGLIIRFLIMSLICLGYTNTFAMERSNRVQKTMKTTEDCPEIISLRDLFKAFLKKKDTKFGFSEFDLGDKRVQISANSMELLKNVIQKYKTNNTSIDKLYYVRWGEIQNNRCVYYEAQDIGRQETKEAMRGFLSPEAYQKRINGVTGGDTKEIDGIHLFPTDNQDHTFGLSFKRLYMMNPEIYE